MGPLQGFRVIELAGIGPGPFCAMVLSDLGADVVRIDRKSGSVGGTQAAVGSGRVRFNVLNRGRRSIALDLKKSEAVSALLRMVESADALIEGFRPGVTERLGLGPDVCLKRNPKLVYGRMTGWGQDGPLAHAAGHDINYISLSGVLHAIGNQESGPVPPLNLVGDFGGGGMLLALGVVAGMLEAQRSGEGQVVDAAMTDGSALLMAGIWGLKAMGAWSDQRGNNLLDTGAHFYGPYECADGKWISIGSIEPQFYQLLLDKGGIEDPAFQAQMDRGVWPELQAKLVALFKSKSREEWCAIMEGSDICFAPILDFDEALAHPHNRARQTFVEVEGVPQPAPAPRFSRTQPQIQGPPPQPGQHTTEALADWGLDTAEIAALQEAEAI